MQNNLLDSKVSINNFYGIQYLNTKKQKCKNSLPAPACILEDRELNKINIFLKAVAVHGVRFEGGKTWTTNNIKNYYIFQELNRKY